MTYKQALAFGQKLLSPISNEALLEAELLLAHTLQISKGTVLKDITRQLSDLDQAAYQTLLNTRFARKPLAQIIGKQEFYKRNFFINDHVLIPRPETEYIVDYVKAYIAENSQAKSSWHVVDIGTGCGNIAVSLACEIPDSHITATEVSEKALQVAQKNASLNHVQNKIEFRLGSLLTPIANEEFDIIVANLPYILSDRIPHLDAEVKDYEPLVSLDGGEDGFKLYRQLFDQLSKSNVPKFFMGEIDYTHQDIAINEALKHFPKSSADVIRDPQGLNRFLLIKFT